MTVKNQPGHPTEPDSKSGGGKIKVLPFALGFGLLLLAGWALWPVFSGPDNSALENSGAVQDGLGQNGPGQNGLVPKNLEQDMISLTMRQQPDHVLFAPAAHSRDMCNQCHNFSEEKYLELFKTSRQAAAGAQSGKEQTPGQPEVGQPEAMQKLDGQISPIGRHEQDLLYQPKPLSMQECMSCHAIAAHLKNTTANNSCSTCHK